MNKPVSKAERKALLREWSRSGKSAREFCEGRGVSEQQIYFWARSARAGDRGPTGRVRLIEAIPIGTKPLSPARTDAFDQRWAWELVGPGAVLRGSDLDASMLLVLMAAVTATGQQ